MKAGAVDEVGGRWTGTLSARITLVLMGILLAFSTTLGVTVYMVTAGRITATAENSLEALATARRAAIEVQVARYLDAFRAFADPHLVGDVRALLRAEGELSGTTRAALAAELARSLRTSELLESAFILGPEGQVLASSRALEGNDTLGARTIHDALLKPSLSAPYRIQEAWYVDVVGPIVGDDGDALAVLRLRARADKLLAITGDHRGLGEAGENVVGMQVGDQVRFLLPMRFAPDPSLLGPLPVTGTLAVPLIAAASGQSGQMVDTDYRGVRVLASYRPIAGTSWGLVVKQDMDEILVDARRVLWALLLAFVGIQVAFLAVVFPLVQTLIQPLRALERTTRRVAAGDLGVEVPEEGARELRALGMAFNGLVKHLRDARTETSRRQEEMESFSYAVSHDLKAPLRGVNSLSEWLEEDLAGKLDPRSLEHLRLLRERVGTMNALIDGLLEYSRVGRVTQPEVHVQVGDVVSRVVGILPAREGIQVTVAKPLPEMYADPVRLAQVFQNLIGNALQHHPGPVGAVEISCQDLEDAWEFSIRDDGSGIDPRYHERIFEIFQVLERRPGTESTGIGLALVKKIVEGRGGEIWVESAGIPGEGTTFHFTWYKKQGGRS
ncbi:MAG: sensor histidine kinase [Longimicrobiales bacterium]